MKIVHTYCVKLVQKLKKRRPVTSVPHSPELEIISRLGDYLPFWRLNSGKEFQKSPKREIFKYLRFPSQK